MPDIENQKGGIRGEMRTGARRVLGARDLNVFRNPPRQTRPKNGRSRFAKTRSFCEFVFFPWKSKENSQKKLVHEITDFFLFAWVGSKIYWRGWGQNSHQPYVFAFTLYVADLGWRRAFRSCSLGSRL